MNLAQKVSLVRKEKGYTQEALAEAANLSLSTIQRIENGKVVPRMHTLQTLSVVLGMDFLNTQPIVNKDEPSTFDLLITVSVCALLTFIPPLSILFLSKELKSKLQEKKCNYAIKKIFVFQVVTFILLMLSVGLIPILTFMITGQKMYGQLNIPFLMYICFVISNLAMTLICISNYYNEIMDLEA